MVSGIRCIITYLLVPVVAPIVNLSSAVSTRLVIVLSVVAIVMGISGIRRFWIADHRLRWAYTAFIGVVILLLVIGIGYDIASLPA